MRRMSIFFSLLFLAACSPPAGQLADAQYNEVARSAGLPILIDRIAVSTPNSAGGVDARYSVTNLSSKTIKYIDLTVQAFNAVGDPVAGEIRRSSQREIRDTGPYAPNQSTGPRKLDNAWYNHTIRCARITRLVVTYMDNSIRTFPNVSAVETILRPGVSNSCRVR